MKKAFITALTALAALCAHATDPARPVSAPGSPGSTYFKAFDTNDGLPDNSVNTIAEDRFGFMWIGTWNGLARFDGKKMECFRHDSARPDGIANNMVRSLLPDAGGLWIGTDNGVDYYSYADAIFHHGRYLSEDNDGPQPLQERISRLFRNGTDVFALTIRGDIMRLEKQNSGNGTYPAGLFSRLPRPSKRRYADMARFTGSRILALSNEGVSLLSADGSVELLHNRIPTGFDANLNIFCDTTAMRVYIGSGIGSPARIYDIDSSGRLHAAQSAPAINALMQTDSDGHNIYMASDGPGLYALTPEGECTLYNPSNSAMPGDAIYAVHCDSHGNVWCGTYRHGLILLSPELNRYTLRNHASGALSYDIVTAVVPRDNKIFLGLDGGGIDIFDPAGECSRNINASNSALPGNNVTSIVHDGTTVWATVYSRGLVAIDPHTDAVRTYSVDTGHESGNKLWVIADDGMGNIWTGGNSIHVFDKQKRTFRLVDECEDLMVMSIVDGGSCIWAATRFSGVLQIDKATRRVIARFSDSPSAGGIKLPTAHTEFLFVDSTGTIWVTLTDGFCAIRRGAGDELRFYNYGKGLSDTRVYSMHEDALGNLWAGTANGLFRYLRDRDIFVRQDDSRLPTTYTHNATGVYDGSLYFGTTAGLVSVPLDMAADAAAADNDIVFTTVDILADGNPSLPIFSNGGGKVRLGAGENFFKVNFTVPEMAAPDQICLECRLDGLEDLWRDVSDTRSATYTNVPPGDYRMLVRHRAPDGTEGIPASLALTILPPWYASTWALILWTSATCTLVLLLLFAWRRNIIGREKANMAELEREAARQLNDSKLDFYANITHELRTPCFLISAQIEEILDSGRHTVPTASLNGIYRNATKLNKLINNILDFRKFDSGHIRLNGRSIELGRFLADMAPDYEQLCRQKSLSFTYVHDPAQPVEGIFDPDKLEMIVTNLISNAYKYTPKGGSVTLSLEKKGDDACISVSDTGIGIVDKMRQAIFEPYFRTERGQRQSSGDGIGLALVKELVELHGGRIELESRVNEGSVFTVVLPCHNSEADAGAAAAAVAGELPAPRPQILAAPEAADSPENAAAINNPTATRSVLIVDDDPEVAALVAHAFEGEYRVTRATDGSEALEMARTGDFDVVITDIMMPGTDGHQLIAALKSDKKLADIKVVVFSALTSEDDTLRALDEGADEYIHKPTPLKVLRRKIDRLFEKSDNHAAMASTAGDKRTYNREEQKFLLECRRIIDECMLDEGFGIDMLAGRLAMSHSSLYKKIRRMTGMSLIDFINEYRIYKAVQLFRAGNTNVQKVSEMCGFRDIKTFRETFKRKMNMPPKQFILTQTPPR